MKGNRKIHAPLALALLMAGCSSVPGLQAPMSDEAVLASNALTPRYSVMADATTEANQVTVADITASSTRNSYFAVSQAIDGNTHSAWGPASTDAEPQLVLDLGGTVSLSALAVKMSPTGVTLKVETSLDGSTWATLAEGLTPEVATLDWIDLTPTEAAYVRLSFEGDAAADVLVCEVQPYADTEVIVPTPAPSTTPSVMPSVTPSTEPSTQPTPTPTATPTAPPTATPTPTPSEMPESDCGCKVTGGGFIFLADGNAKNKKVSFGFNAQGTETDAKGQIEVNDHTTKLKYHGSVTGLVCGDDSITFTGTLKDGVAFSATVSDLGEPGRQDTFEFSAGSFHVSGELEQGGNIQRHELKCDEE